MIRSSPQAGNSTRSLRKIRISLGYYDAVTGYFYEARDAFRDYSRAVTIFTPDQWNADVRRVLEDERRRSLRSTEAFMCASASRVGLRLPGYAAGD